MSFQYTVHTALKKADYVLDKSKGYKVKNVPTVSGINFKKYTCPEKQCEVFVPENRDILGYYRIFYTVVTHDCRLHMHHKKVRHESEYEPAIATILHEN
jgi:hypothetical protein